MSKSKKSFPWRLLLIFLILVGFTFGTWKGYSWWQKSRVLKIEESATAVLDRIQKVSKLITVEGYFSEIYDYKDYYFYDVSLFRKKALIRIKAKVSMGVDFESLVVDADQATKTVRFGPLPPVEILSIDHDLDYYDISEGSFNSFTEKDYNKLQSNAKEYIRNVALQSDLVQQAEEQTSDLIDLIRFYVESVGWELIVPNTESSALAN